MKKVIAVSLALCVLSFALSACKTAGHTGDETTTLSAEYTSKDSQYPPESPVLDFEYQVRDEGGIEITKYKGQDDHVVIPQAIDGKEVTVIGECAFLGSAIASVTMPDTVIYLSSSAFRGCQNLTNVKLSSSLITVGWGTFSLCDSLTSIDLSMDSMQYIDWDAFYSCKKLKTVKFGDNIQLIRDKAFYGCESLEEVILPKNLREIGEYAFENCIGIQKIWIPKTLEKWGWSPFLGNISVTEIVFEDGLKRIGSYGAFAGCQVEVLRIPASVEYIADIAFTAFRKLKEVYFEGAAPEVSADGGNVFATPEHGVKIYYNPAMLGWDTTPLRNVYTLITLS